jgi:cell division protein FtsI/penicillin-binding protein 2
MNNGRLLLVEALLFLFAAAVVGRLFYWQVLKHEGFQVAAKNQIENTVLLGAQRGKILASDGSVLVSNQKAYLVYTLLPEIKKLQGKNETYEDLVKKVTDQLVPILLEEKIALEEDLDQKKKDKLRNEIREAITYELHLPNLIWVPVAKKVSEETKQKIEQLNIKGVGFEKDTKRFYPEGSLAASMLGFVGKDEQSNDKGYFGLEGYYDDKLRGRPGRLVQETDALGRPILAAPAEGFEALNGLDLVTTIDRTAQFVADRKIKEGVERYGAKGGAVIILDPKTGAVLANSSYPTFDLQDPTDSESEDYKNLGTSQSYEPGSTFKSITFSSALDSGSIKTDTICPCQGPIQASGYEVQTVDNKYHPNSTITEILQHSDNVGAAFAAEKMGADTFLKYLSNFGFGQVSGVDLQGEETGIIKARQDWNEIELVTAAFGQGLSVTPIQMVNAVASIANGGKLMKPYVVKKIVGPKGETVFKPKEIHQVIKPETAETMKQLLLAAVEGGEARKIIPQGYRVAGKTGTAQVPLGGHYSTKTVASFVGFGPVENPKFTMVVGLFEPSASIWASETAEPLFFEIAKELYPYWGISVQR